MSESEKKKVVEEFTIENGELGKFSVKVIQDTESGEKMAKAVLTNDAWKQFQANAGLSSEVVRQLVAARVKVTGAISDVSQKCLEKGIEKVEVSVGTKGWRYHGSFKGKVETSRAEGPGGPIKPVTKYGQAKIKEISPVSAEEKEILSSLAKVAEAHYANK